MKESGLVAFCFALEFFAFGIVFCLTETDATGITLCASTAPTATASLDCALPIFNKIRVLGGD